MANIQQNYSDFYEITNKVLGTGYFAKVMLGIDKKTQENVAIKVIDKTKVEESPQLLLNEINIMTQVQHPNIISLKAVFETNTHLYIVMELVRGGELYELILERKAFCEKDASHIMKQLFNALEYLHRSGIVHRDLKLENLLLENKDSLIIKLTDFGLSKLYSGKALQTACGTPFYVAPDVLLGEGYGPAVDMWASGILLYILLSGRLPFHADNDAQLFQLIIECKLVFKSPQFNSVSQLARDLIRKLLNVDPNARLSASEALKHPFIADNIARTEPLGNSVREDIGKISMLSRGRIDRKSYTE